MSFGDRFVKALPSSTFLSGALVASTVALPALYFGLKGIPMDSLADAYRQYMSNENILQLLKSTSQLGIGLAAMRAAFTPDSPQPTKAWDDELSPEL